jgi:hypothetical protein
MAWHAGSSGRRAICSPGSHKSSFVKWQVLAIDGGDPAAS